VRGLAVELPTRTAWVRPVNYVSFALAEGEALGIVGDPLAIHESVQGRRDDDSSRIVRSAVQYSGSRATL